MSSSKELKLYIDAIDSGVARMMLLDGAVFEFPAALLPEGAAVGEFLRGFGTSVAVTGIVALAVIFTPLVRHLHRRVEALMREITIHE